MNDGEYDRIDAPVPPEIIAHRGYSARAPENTLSALRLALDVGAPALEWDIQVSRSGTAYLFHDDTLDRTTDGSGRFAHRTDADLASLDAGTWFGPEYAGEPIPTLAETLSSLDGRALRIYPEIKTFRFPSHVDDIVTHVRESGWLDSTVFISIDWEALDQVRRRAPDVHIGYIVEDPSRYGPALERARHDPCAVIDSDYRIVLADPAQTRLVREAGIPLAVWTVNQPEQADRLYELGVRRFTTNEVERLLAWAATKEAGV